MQKLPRVPRKYVLFVGSIQPRKNLTTLLSAWRKIRNEFNDLWLVIAGGMGHVFRADQLEEVGRVCFLGYVSDDDLPGLYANAELLVLPSHDEGFGLPVLEAMACGTPVIANAVGGLLSLVEHERTGYLVADRDSEVFARHTAHLLDHSDVAEQMGAADRKSTRLNSSHRT